MQKQSKKWPGVQYPLKYVGLGFFAVLEITISGTDEEVFHDDVETQRLLLIFK